MGAMTSLIGTRVDCYEILSVLGQGGMGVVYLARDETLDREVALKMMDAGLARDESFLKRFQSEAKALAKLQNPNIVGIFALRETEFGFCIVMEYVHGDTLADQLRDRGVLPLDRALRIFKQILTAVDHAHSAGIIHRDIKPANIMLTPDDVVKVADFGLAKIQEASQATMTMGTGGTLYYMSPEQVRGLANVDARGDIYSLGMTLYEALTGVVPFGEDTDFSIRTAIVEGKIPSPETFLPTLPKDVVRVIMKSIERDPEQRFQTAAEMWKALEIVGNSSPASVAPARTEALRPAASIAAAKAPAKSADKRFPLVAVIIAVVALLALGGGGYFWWTSRGPATQAQNVPPATEPFASKQQPDAPKQEAPNNAAQNATPNTAQQTDPAGAAPVEQKGAVPKPPETGKGGAAEKKVQTSSIPEKKIAAPPATIPANTEPVKKEEKAKAAIERVITIGVRPTYANISVNGESIGQSDSKVITRGPGRYKVTVTKADYEIDHIELNGKDVPSGDITVSQNGDDKPVKLIFFLKKKS